MFVQSVIDECSLPNNSSRATLFAVKAHKNHSYEAVRAHPRIFDVWCYNVDVTVP